MSLTKEECDKDVEEIEAIYYSGDTSFSAMKLFKTSIENIYKLIKKYFELKEKYSKILDDVHDYRYEVYAMKMTIRNLCKYFGVKNEEELKNIYLNPPLKFEELEEEMVIWDNKTKMFIKIFDVATLEENCFSFEVFGLEVPIYDEQFEENRFYRKQVE